MKITDDKLEELAAMLQNRAQGNPSCWEQDVTDVIIECQQHRAEKHERRWRKISEESPDKSCKVAYSDGKAVVYGYCVVDETGITWMLDTHFMVQNLDGVWWCPQETDLPEGE